MAPAPKESVIEDDQYFRVIINERTVDDISLDFFYKPHTITLLITCISGLLYFAFTRNEESQEQNIWNGLSCVLFFFLIISVLAFPNGPFTRPHPAIWRMVFGLSVFYFMMLLFVLFQTHTDIRRMMIWLFPDLKDSGPDEKEYAVNCSDMSVQRLWNSLDVFILCHFFGWVTKALLIRHYGILWTISVMWEITEVVFAHLLPNFAECWWDAILLDIVLCNGLGIWLGMWLCRKLEIRDYHWESIKDIHTATGKLRRAVLQFTPVSWLYVRWLDPNSTTMRIIAVYILILAWQLVELNTFFLKHIFYLQPSHMLNLVRLLLICSISAPTIRQYYVYATDIRCKRVGTQLWVFCAIMLTESIICIKFGLQMFRQTEVSYIIVWLCIQMVGSFVCIYLCALFAERWNKWKHLSDADSPIRSMKYSSALDKSPTPSPYSTATSRNVQMPVGIDKQEEEEVLIANAATRDIHHLKRHRRDHHDKNASKNFSSLDEEDDTVDDPHDVPPQSKTSSKSRSSRRRGRQVDEREGDGQDNVHGQADARGNTLRKPVEDGGNEYDEEDEDENVSAQVESLISGQLLANGYHPRSSSDTKKQSSADRKKSSSKRQHQHHPAAAAETVSHVRSRAGAGAKS